MEIEFDWVSSSPARIFMKACAQKRDFINLGFPVTNVKWKNAIKFVNRLSRLEELEECYNLSGYQVKWTKNWSAKNGVYQRKQSGFGINMKMIILRDLHLWILWGQKRIIIN